MALEAGRKYAPSEIRRHNEAFWPQPFDAYPIDAPAPGWGQGLKRKSTNGTRWCPFCQTPLTGRPQARDDCRPKRAEHHDERERPPKQPKVRPRPAGSYDIDEIHQLFDAIDDLMKHADNALAQLNERGYIHPELQSDWLGSCKAVACRADDLQRAAAGKPPA